MKWRRWLLITLVAAVYVAMRLTFNHEYEGAPWSALVDGSAELPFGHRILVPILVRPFHVAGVPLRTAFAVTEWFAAVAALTGVEAVLLRYESARTSTIGTAMFVGVLCLAFLLPFQWPVFYPWDTPAIACTAWGVAWAHDRRYGVLVILAAVGAANRESAVLLPVITLLVAWGTSGRATAWRAASLQFVAVVLVRLSIGALRPVSEGHIVDLDVAGMSRIEHNLQWLTDPVRALSMLGAWSMLPVLWLVVRNSIPASLRRLEWLFPPLFGGLMVVANVYEPRAWGEMITLLYLGVATGVARAEFGRVSRTRGESSVDSES